MKNSLDQFLAAAKNISLREGERSEMANVLGIRVRERNADRPQRHMNETQFFRVGKRISMTAAERAAGKEFVLNGLARKQASWWMFSLKSFTTVVAAVLIVAVGGASASYAAESALPGDFLYPVKIHVNEEVKTRMIKDKESLARWHAERAARRLQEAETLARSSGLTEDKRVTVTENFKKHARAVNAELTSLQAENNEAAGAVGMDFEAVLRAHSFVLDTLGEGKVDQENSIAALMHDVYEARLETEEGTIRSSLKKTPVARTVFTDSTLNRARAEVAAAEKTMKNDRSQHAGESLLEAKRSLADAEETKSPDVRMNKARAALRTAKEAGIRFTAPKSTTAAVRNEKADSNMKNDSAFGAEVRMRITKRSLQKLGETIKDKPLNEDISIRMETQMTGAQQLLDIAEIQMDAGQDSDALEASDMALKHAEAAEKTVSDTLNLAE